MNITWDNIDSFKILPDGRFKNGRRIYTLIDHCEECKSPFFTLGQNIGKYCSIKCSKIGERNPFYGKKHSKKDIDTLMTFKGIDSVNYKCGRNNCWYDTYQKHLSPYGVECHNNEGILEVKCVYCGKWFAPNVNAVTNKIKSIRGGPGENNLYCSNGCKYNCPTYKTILYQKDLKVSTSREIQPQLRKLVFERDKYMCQRCNKTGSLHCHHITGVEVNPIESADIDNCITLCEVCHIDTHKQKGCKYNDLHKC